RLPRGRARQLLPHDSVGEGTQRNAARRRRKRRGRGERDRRRRQGPGVMARAAARKTVLGVVAAVGLAAAGGGAHAAAEVPDWDQAANIKDAALRLAEMQRTQGATRAFEFINACYKTHSLSSNYTKAFEACIAQDYLETQVLALIYSRMPAETL